MTDEPVLCFDGDAAGRRAAYRAVDMALPLLKPGKSLRFAMLPEGQDPTIWCAPAAARRSPRCSAARARSPRCCGCARPKATFDTPERRAALEARLDEVPGTSATIRCANITGRTSPPGCGAVCAGACAGGERAARARLAAPSLAAKTAQSRPERLAAARALRPRRAATAGPYVVVSPQLTAARHRGFRSAMPPREALILQAVLNHPWLLHDHLEEFAELEFRHPDAEQLKAR